MTRQGILTLRAAGALAGTLPLTKQTETGHVGIAGWVAPDTTMNSRAAGAPRARVGSGSDSPRSGARHRDRSDTEGGPGPARLIR